MSSLDEEAGKEVEMSHSLKEKDDRGPKAYGALSVASRGRVPESLVAVAKAFCQKARGLLAHFTAMQRRAGKPKRLELVEALALGGRRQLFVVLYDNQRYLVGAGAESVGTIVPIETRSAPTEKAAGKRPHLVRERGRDTCRIVSADPLRRKSFEAVAETGDLWQ